MIPNALINIVNLILMCCHYYYHLYYFLLSPKARQWLHLNTLDTSLLALFIAFVFVNKIQVFVV